MHAPISRPVLTCIEVQSGTWLEEGNEVEKKMSYLKLTSTSGQELVFGQPTRPGFDGEETVYTEVTKLTGDLVIVGVGFFDNKVVMLQVL